MPQLVPDDARLKSLLFLAIGVYWALDLLVSRTVSSSRILVAGKVLLIAVAVSIIVILPTLQAVVLRHQTEPYYYVHDGLIQSEAATGFVLQGRNPYVETYYDTPMVHWGYRVGDPQFNPALEHYAYMPATFLLPLPFQYSAEKIFGWFDQRLIYLVFFVAALCLVPLLVRQTDRRLALVLLLALNPLSVLFFIEGRNDILSLFLLMLVLVLLVRGRTVGAAVVLGLACATKQLTWFFVPYFILLVMRQDVNRPPLRQAARHVVVIGAVFAVIALPWALADPGGFVGDILYFQSTPMSAGFPINGFSLGVLLWTFGVLYPNADQFPFWLTQLAATLLVMSITLRRQWRQPVLSWTVASFGLALFAVGFFSQFFHENYLGFIMSIMAVAYFLESDCTAVAPGSVNHAARAVIPVQD